MATTLSRAMKKAAASSSVILPLSKTSTITISPTNQVSRATSIPNHHHFSALSDRKPDTNDRLLSLIESEYDSAENKLRKFIETPIELPFKIVKDEPGIQMTDLAREYQGDKIEFIASMRSGQQSVRLLGDVSNKSGLKLKFDITAYAEDGIKIKSLNVTDANWETGYPNETCFSDLGENLQKAFLKYFEVRGIEPSFTKNFYKCISKIRHEKYTVSLKNLKNFFDTSNNLFGTISIPTHRYYAPAEKISNADDTLLSVIESEVDCAEEKFHKIAEPPIGFAFKIMDNPGEKFIRLTREYQGEEIEVEVNGPRINYTDEKKEDKDDQEAYHLGDKEKSRYINLGVSVSKKSGLTLRFDVNCNLTERIITGINRLEVENRNASEDDHNGAYRDYHEYYKEPDFSDFDKNVQNTFHKYLEVRGFEHSSVKFLCDYMVQREHAPFLKKLKTFIAN